MSRFEQFWADNHVLRWISMAILAGVLIAVVVKAQAIEPGLYAPTDNGEGININCNDADECAVYWFTHGKAGEQLWLTATELCQRGSAVCDTELAQTTGLWRGLGGDTVIAEPTVTLSLTVDGDGLVVSWDARAQFPDRCFGVGPGGLIFENCIGTKRFDLLAR